MGKLVSSGRTNGLPKLLKNSFLRLCHLQRINSFLSRKLMKKKVLLISLIYLSLNSQLAFEQALEIQQVLENTILDDLNNDA